MSTKLGKSNPCRVVPLQGGTKWGFWGAANVLGFDLVFSLRKFIELSVCGMCHFLYVLLQ